MTFEEPEQSPAFPLSVRDLKAAGIRKNTIRAASSAIRHYEEVFHGRLPASSASVEYYVVFCLEQGLAVSTISQRVALLASWHRELGFPDPTADKGVKAVLKGAGVLKGRAPKQAAPLTYQQLVRLVETFDREIADAAHLEHPRESQRVALTAIRDKALFLTGFWFAFRSDELVRLDFDHLHFGVGEPKQGQPAPRTLEIFLPSTKGDRNAEGQTWCKREMPTLCPINALLDWKAARMVCSGPVFVKVNRWGSPGTEMLHHNSVTALMRAALSRAGIAGTRMSSHSLRRGFATYAATQGASVTELIKWVKWSDVRSPTRYMDTLDDLPHRLLSKPPLFLEA